MLQTDTLLRGMHSGRCNCGHTRKNKANTTHKCQLSLELEVASVMPST
jgi:hypothetical protein